jgi:hypothetical protein
MEGQETQTLQAPQTVSNQELTIEEFFGVDEKPDHLRETSQQEESKKDDANVQASTEEKKPEKTKSEDTQLQEMSEDRLNELTAKAEKENLTEEEVAELKAAGHEVGVQEPSVDEILAQMANGEQVDLTDLSEETINALKEKGVEIVEIGDDTSVKWIAPDIAGDLQQMYGDQFDVNTIEGFNEAAKDVLNKYNTITNNLNGVLENSPELQKIMEAMMKGSDFMSAASLELGIEDLNPSPGDDGYEAWVEAKAQKKIQKDAEKKRQDEIKANWKTSQDNVVRYFKDNEVPKDRQTKIVNTLDALVNDYAQGKVDGYVDLIAKGLYADADSKKQAQQAVAKELNKRYIIQKKNVGSKPSVRSASVDVQPGTQSLEQVKKLFGEI